MYTTLQLLKDNSACANGYSKLLGFFGLSLDLKEQRIPLHALALISGIPDLNWALKGGAVITPSAFEILFNRTCIDVMQFKLSEQGGYEEIKSFMRSVQIPGYRNRGKIAPGSAKKKPSRSVSRTAGGSRRALIEEEDGDEFDELGSPSSKVQEEIITPQSNLDYPRIDLETFNIIRAEVESLRAGGAMTKIQERLGTAKPFLRRLIQVAECRTSESLRDILSQAQFESSTNTVFQRILHWEGWRNPFVYIRYLADVISSKEYALKFETWDLLYQNGPDIRVFSDLSAGMTPEERFAAILCPTDTFLWMAELRHRASKKVAMNPNGTVTVTMDALPPRNAFNVVKSMLARTSLSLEQTAPSPSEVHHRETLASADIAAKEGEGVTLAQVKASRIRHLSTAVAEGGRAPRHARFAHDNGSNDEDDS